MEEVAVILSCLSMVIDRSTLKKLKIISQAMLCMTGRVTMLGLSRWTEIGGSYRTLQRFFKKHLVASFYK